MMRWPNLIIGMLAVILFNLIGGAMQWGRDLPTSSLLAWITAADVLIFVVVFMLGRAMKIK